MQTTSTVFVALLAAAGFVKASPLETGLASRQASDATTTITVYGSPDCEGTVVETYTIMGNEGCQQLLTEGASYLYQLSAGSEPGTYEGLFVAYSDAMCSSQGSMTTNTVGNMECTTQDFNSFSNTINFTPS